MDEYDKPCSQYVLALLFLNIFFTSFLPLFINLKIAFAVAISASNETLYARNHRYN